MNPTDETLLQKVVLGLLIELPLLGVALTAIGASLAWDGAVWLWGRRWT